MTSWFTPSQFLCLLIAFSGVEFAMAGELNVRVVGVDGRPVPDVAVFVEPVGSAPAPRRSPESTVMDQRDKRFVPHILIVEKGATVEFPNSDITAHHVYSFSRPNNFTLPLYKGTPPDPIAFDHDGVVILGCNIHDSMLGYIVVVDTNVFGLTDETGNVSMSVNGSASNYNVSIWSPRIRDSRDPLTQVISALPSDGAIFNLRKSLRPAHIEHSESVQWDEY
jgi:plastocyanin